MLTQPKSKSKKLRKNTKVDFVFHLLLHRGGGGESSTSSSVQKFQMRRGVKFCCGASGGVEQGRVDSHWLCSLNKSQSHKAMLKDETTVT